MDERLTLDEWSRRLAIIRGSGEDFSVESFETAELLSEQAQNFKTPAKKNDNGIVIDDTEFDLANVYLEVKQKIEDIEVFATRKPLAGEISRILHGVEESLEDVTSSLNVNPKKLEQVEDKVGQELPVLFSRHETLESAVGSRSVNSSVVQDMYQTSTLWGSVSVLSGVMEDT
jgi:hypothetical protein